MSADKAAKVADGRKSGEGTVEKEEDTRAGGKKQVQFDDVPEEFDAVDFTAAESGMRENLQGPDTSWLRKPADEGRVWGKAMGESAPSEAKNLVKRAEDMITGPVLGRLHRTTSLPGQRRELPEVQRPLLRTSLARWRPTAWASWRRKPHASWRVSWGLEPDPLAAFRFQAQFGPPMDRTRVQSS